MSTQLIDVKADIRDRLLHVAIRLFAEKGIDAVSLRTISTEAGSKNKSAVHYHFGSKLGIVEAIFEEFTKSIEQADGELLKRLEKRAENKQISIAEILLAFYLPLFTIRSSKSYGEYAIKLLAKMMLECTPEYQILYQRLFQRRVTRIYQQIQKQLPNKSAQDLKFQLMHGLMATITGIATIDLMDRSPLGDIRFSNEIQMTLSYVDYVTGGLKNEESSINQIDTEFWQGYFQDQFIFPKKSTFS